MNTRRHRSISIGLAASLALLAGGMGVAQAQSRADADVTNKEVGSNQVLLGSLVADAVRASAKTDIAFVPASAFTENIVTVPRASFRVTDVVKSLEYKGDTIAIVKLTGDQLRATLEQSLYQYPKSNVGFLQTSGLTVTFKPSASGSKRIESIKVNGSALEGGKTYKVAMPLPLANGAHAYFKFWKKSDIDKDTGVTLETALTSYLNDHKTIAKGEDRLIVTGK